MYKTFISFYIGALFHPKKTFESLKLDERSLRFSFGAVAVMALLYTFVYVFLILGGGQPFKPWLDIPLESYYKYNVFFCAPSMFLGWILAAGVVQLLSHLFSGTGTFEQTLAVLGFGIGIASWSTGLHDIISSFLGAIQVINQSAYEVLLNTPTVWRTLLWILMITYLLWFIYLFFVGVKTVQGMKSWQALMIGTFGFFVYQLFFFIFNR